MNGYKYRQSNIAFDSRLKELVTKIKKEFKNGNIKTQTDYACQMKNTVFEFYKSLGKPAFKFHPASDIPSYSHYLDMVEKAVSDMNVLIAGCSVNSKNISVAQNEMNDTVNMLLRRTSGALSKVNGLEKKINSIRSASSVIHTDDFKEDNNTLFETKTQDITFADTSTGTLILQPIKNKSAAETVDIEILDSSNGMPGNTHEVFHSIGGQNGNIKYKGENNPHLSLSSIKTGRVSNNSSGDWFEFELYNLEEDVMEKTAGVGFKYKEGVSWVSEDNELRLTLKIDLNELVNTNYIMIEGIPKTNSNVSNPILKRIIVSDEQAIVQTIDINEELIERKIIPYDSQKTRTITIEIVQSESVDTQVCRQYALNIDPTRIPKFVDNDFKDFIQTEKPQHSIELLGLKYDSSQSKIIYPNTKDSNDFLDAEYVKSQLFYSNKSENNYKIESEIVKAKRYFIGIREIDIRERNYIETGVYVSKKFYSDEPIRTLILNADDYIPDKFRKHLKDGQNFDDFIKYYISFDDGNEWHNIYPRHKAHNGPCTIVINSNSSVVSRNKNICYIDMLSDPTDFLVKIELSRPSEIIDETPIVKSYMVDVSTEEDI